MLHCPLSRPDLIYISLLIVFCLIEYVTNKKTLEPCFTIEYKCWIFCLTRTFLCIMWTEYKIAGASHVTWNLKIEQKVQGFHPLWERKKGSKVSNDPCCTAFDLPVSEPHAYHLALIAPGADRISLFPFSKCACWPREFGECSWGVESRSSVQKMVWLSDIMHRGCTSQCSAELNK